MDSLIKLLQQRFKPVQQGFMQSPLGALAQGKPQQFMPALKQRADFFVQHPENISFGGDMQAVNPGGFAGALPFNTQVDQMTSQPIVGQSLARPGFDRVKAIVPQSDRIQTTGGYSIPAQSNADALVYEGAMKSGDVGLMDKLMQLHPKDARFSVHANFPGIIKNLTTNNPIANTAGVGRSIHPADLIKAWLPGTHGIPL